MNLVDYPVEKFIAELASSSPAPGGGSVAALCGALGAALVAMVSNLTIGREKYRGVEITMRHVLGRANDLHVGFLALIDEDAMAFNAYMEARKLPKETESDIAFRAEAMEFALKNATNVPLKVMEVCVSLAEIAREAATHGNPNALSDAGVAALLAAATAKAAAYNMRINLPGIQDKNFVEKGQARMTSALSKVDLLVREVEAKLEEGL